MTTETLIPPVPIVPSFKLGKLEPLHDPRTLMLADYLDRASLPRVPSSHAWSSRVHSWGVMLNDRCGDCAIAAPGHQIQLWTTCTKPSPFVPSDQQILSAYSAVSGYDPRQTQPNGENPTDVGCNLLNVLKYWKNVGIAGHRIDGYAAVDPRNAKLIATAIFLFGGIDIGVNLPAAAQQQISRNQPWTLTTGPASQPGTWGGHSVEVLDFAPDGLVCVTWGRLQKMTWEWFMKYCDESFCILSHDWLFNGVVSPSGLDLATLQQDMHLI